MIIPSCIISQNAIESGIRWLGAGKNTNVIRAIQANRPISKNVSEITSALAAALSPRPRIGAIAKYWNTIPSATANT